MGLGVLLGHLKSIQSACLWAQYSRFWGYICRCTYGTSLKMGFHLPTQFSCPSSMVEFQVLSSSRSKLVPVPVACLILLTHIFSAALDSIDNSDLGSPSVVLSTSHCPGLSGPSGPSFSHPPSPCHSLRFNIWFSDMCNFSFVSGFNFHLSDNMFQVFIFSPGARHTLSIIC